MIVARAVSSSMLSQILCREVAPAELNCWHPRQSRETLRSVCGSVVKSIELAGEAAAAA